MNTLKFFSLLLFGSLFMLQACNSEDPDNEAPQIVINSPWDDQHFYPGETIIFDAEFSDNIELSQFKIDIHYGGDHDHKSGQTNNEDNEWSFDYIGDLSGQYQHVQMSIEIPEDAKPGVYDFLVFCTDLSGNESMVFFLIDIEQEDDH